MNDAVSNGNKPIISNTSTGRTNIDIANTSLYKERNKEVRFDNR